MRIIGFSLIFLFLTFSGIEAVHGEFDEEGSIGKAGDVGYELEIVRNDIDSEVLIRVEVEEITVREKVIGDKIFSVVEIPEAGSLIKAGEPMLPVISRLFRISDTREAHVDVTPLRTRVIELTSPILPGQEMEIEDINEINSWDKGLYSRDAVFPEERLKLGSPEILRDLRVMQVSYCPVSYNAEKNELEVAEEYEISIRAGEESTVNVKRGPKTPITSTWGDLYAAVIPNYDESETTREGEEHYLVVIQSEMTPYLQEWQQWKEQEGFTVDVMTINYSTSDSQLRNMIVSEYFSVNKPVFVMLVGREHEIPVHDSYYSYYWHGSPWSGYYTDDSYYSRIEGTDYLPDVFISRLPGKYSTPTMLERALYWERTPNMVEDYYSKAQMACSGLYESQQTVKEQTAERLVRVHNFETIYTAYDWNYSTKSILMGHIDDGVSIVNYRGEGWTSGWTPGHAYSFTYNDVEDLNNLNKPLVISSIGCGVCMFDSGICFGEAWMRLGDEDDIKGAVAVLGPTGNTHTTFNNWLDRGLYRGLAYDDLSYVSQAFLAGKLYMKERLSEYDEIVEMQFGKFLQFGTPDTRYRTMYPREPAWGFAFSPTSMLRYICVRTAENWRAVGAKVAVEPEGGDRVILTLGSKGEGSLDCAYGYDSVPVHIAGYNIKPFQADLNLRSDTGRLLITEVKPDIYTDGDYGDIVEIYNMDSQSIDLKNIIVTDLDLYDIPITKNSAVLQPGDIAVIHFIGPRGVESIVPTIYGLEIKSRAYPDFNSEEDQCVIRDGDGIILDGLAWHDADGIPATRNDYRDLSRFTPPTSYVGVADDGWFDAPDDTGSEEYEIYTIDWSQYAGMDGPGSIQRISYGTLDSKDSFEVREFTTWGLLSAPPHTPTPIPPTNTPTNTATASPTRTPTGLPTDTPTRTPTLFPTWTPTYTATKTPSPTFTATSIYSPTPFITQPPSMTPDVTPEPTGPSPTPGTIGIRLEMPKTTYYPGDICFLTATTYNYTGSVYPDVRIMVILDVNIDIYWCWPSWAQCPPGFDSLRTDIYEGENLHDVIDPFEWPEGAGSALDIHFHAGIVNYEVTRIIGDIDSFTFSYAE